MCSGRVGFPHAAYCCGRRGPGQTKLAARGCRASKQTCAPAPRCSVRIVLSVNATRLAGVRCPKCDSGAPHEFTHGASGYRHHGCRCDICAAGKSEYERQYHERMKQTAPPCTVEGCDKRARTGQGGLCNKHRWRFQRYGDFELRERVGRRGVANHMWVGHAASYNAVHDRLMVRRGPASEHRCVDCNGQAEEWSYDNADINEKRGSRNNLLYSTDANHYEPRCKPCHRNWDAYCASVALQ
jgi:hypothetical protein